MDISSYYQHLILSKFPRKCELRKLYKTFLGTNFLEVKAGVYRHLQWFQMCSVQLFGSTLRQVVKLVLSYQSVNSAAAEIKKPLEFQSVPFLGTRYSRVTCDFM